MGSGTKNVGNTQQPSQIYISTSQIYISIRFLGSLTSHYRRFKPDVDPILKHASSESGSLV